MSLFANERFSNSNHITAETDARANNAIIAGNCVFDFGSKFALTVSPAAGTVTVSDGVLSFSGRNCGVILTESAEYSPPPSDTVYTKNIVVLRYSRDTSTNIETFRISVISSDVQESESAATAADVSLSTNTITESTVTADFPLWSFIATASSNTTPVQLFTVVPGIAQLNNILTAVNKALTQEIADRKTAVSNEASARVTSHNTLVGYLNTTNANVSANTKAIENLKRKNILLARNSNGIESQTFNYSITDFSMLAIRYTIAGLGDTKYMVIPTFARGDIDGSTNTYSITENNRVVSKGTLGSVDIDVQSITINITVSSEKFSVSKSGSSTTKMIEIVGIY